MGTGRARGRHAPRMGAGGQLPTQGVDPESPIGREEGVSDRVQGTPSPIPGGKDHIGNAITFRQTVPASAPDQFTDLPVDNLHGVAPGSHTGLSRAQIVRGELAARKGADQYYTPQPPPARPIPVYVVENADKTPVYRTVSPRNVPVPALGATPVTLCGRDPKRVQVLLLNESATTVRIGQNYTDVLNGGGALLPAAMGSYLRLPTQDTLYAVTTNTGSAATLSIMQVFDTEGSGL